MNKFACVLLVALAISPCLRADSLSIVSTSPADVYLDGNYVGAAPVSLDPVAPGEHAIRVTERTSGKSVIFPILATNQTRKGQIVAQFAPGQPKEIVVTQAAGQVKGQVEEAQAPDEEEPVRRVRHVRHHHVYYSEERGYYHHHNQKARVRNVSAGVTGLGLITGSRFLTGMGLGGIIANESR